MTASTDGIPRRTPTAGPGLGGTAGDPRDRYRLTFDRAPVGLAHVAPDGAWLAVNDRLCEIVGRTRADLLARSLQDITHPDDLSADLLLLGRLLAGEIDRYQLEKRFLRADGSPVWVRLTMALVRDPDTQTPAFFIKAVEDIDDRRRGEDALRASEQRLNALVATAMDAILTACEDQKIVSINPAAEAMFGYTAAEAVGQPLTLLMPERFRGGHGGHVRRFQESGETARSRDAFGVLTARRKDGSEFPIEASVSRFTRTAVPCSPPSCAMCPSGCGPRSVWRRPTGASIGSRRLCSGRCWPRRRPTPSPA